MIGPEDPAQRSPVPYRATSPFPGAMPQAPPEGLPAMSIATILTLCTALNTPQTPFLAQDAGSKVLEPTAKMVENRSLGCSFALPKDGAAIVTGGASNPQIRVVQGDADPPAWEIVAQRIELPVPEGGFGEPTAITPDRMLKAFVADAEKSNDGDLQISDKATDLRIDKLPAASVTAFLGHESGRTARFDWMFIQTGPNRFLLLQFLADRDRWPTSIFDQVLETLEIQTEPELAIGSMQLVDRGRAVIAEIDENALRSVIPKLQDGAYYRLEGIDPESGKPRELGCSRLIAMETTRDAVRDSRAPTPLTEGQAEGDTGLLVWMQVRVLPRTSDGPYQDVDLRAWLSWDREEEWWTMRTTVRIKGSEASRTNAVTGLRPRPLPRDPRRWLQVISGGRESFERNDRKLQVPDLGTFLSEAERLVLPELLGLIEAPKGEFGVYAWNEDRLSITRRLEDWLPGSDSRQPGTLLSRPAADAPPATQVLGRDGVLRQRITPLAGGRVTWSRIELDKLRTLYLQKGIPFDG